MPGIRKEMHKRGNYNRYGDSAMTIDIGALEEHGAFVRLLSKDVPKYGVCINAMSAYTIKGKPLEDGHSITNA